MARQELTSTWTNLWVVLAAMDVLSKCPGLLGAEWAHQSSLAFPGVIQRGKATSGRRYQVLLFPVFKVPHPLLNSWGSGKLLFPTPSFLPHPHLSEQPGVSSHSRRQWAFHSESNVHLFSGAEEGMQPEKPVVHVCSGPRHTVLLYLKQRRTGGEEHDPEGWGTTLEKKWLKKNGFLLTPQDLVCHAQYKIYVEHNQI